ncbi:putative disease resistance protein RGA3 [Bienertia sinuspersici]
MDASTGLTLVQTILQVFDTSIFSEIESFLGYKAQLDKLKDTMYTIKAVLLNAEKQEMLQNAAISTEKITLERLKEAVYQADDLFDEVATIVQRKKLMNGNKVCKEVRLFFSRFNQLHYASSMSREKFGRNEHSLTQTDTWALTLVQTVLQVFDASIFSEVESLLGYKSQLNKLKATMSTINSVLLNAEKQEMLQKSISIPKITLERLKEAVYQADDLFDEVATVVQRKKLMGGNKVCNEVRLFFSRFNQLHYAFTKSREISKIREILDDIAKDHHRFGSIQTVNFEVRQNNQRETHSVLCEEDVIIGRDDDKRIVIDMLLDTAVEKVVSVVSIVGIGGLGKTTLAQLVYNDETIVKGFSLRMWVCVSDDFDVKVLLGKILAAATNQAIDNNLSMDQLQRKLHETLDGKKFLLVLDDIWNEDPSKWEDLRKSLTKGQRGSRVIVTTRSVKVAYVVGSQWTHELKGLSEQDSWNLFEKMTLEPGQVQLEGRLTEIGKEIVRKCVNVPLAIRVAGSLVKGNPEESWWEYLKNIDMANMKQDENGIVNVLKISYHYLPPHLKSCFTYCAIYPKDYEIKKEKLIDLWMAQGYIHPLDGQSFEVLGEEYFMNLLQRCFFQDVQRDIDGGISSCKMHDLIHDLAKEIAGEGIKSSDDRPNSLNDKTRHFFIGKRIDVGCHLTNMKKMRSFLVSDYFILYRDMCLPTVNMRYLRILDLHGNKLKKLPSKIGDLLHLRYLDLSGNKFNLLPNSITRLYNLQTLKLQCCMKLKQLPKNLSKLVNLRHLDTHCCDSLRQMPPGMNALHKLSLFVVGKNIVGGLEELKNLNHLRGFLDIWMQSGWTCDATKVREGRYLINKPHLTGVSIRWRGNTSEVDSNAEDLLQGLQPHSNVRRLWVTCYPGVSFPSWDDSSMDLKTCLPNLVEIEVDRCNWLKHLPLLSKLRKLKVLKIEKLGKLEYMESRSNSNGVLSGGSRGEDELVFFPSLETLELSDLPELKGWWEPASHTDSRLASNEDEIEIGNNHSKQQQEFPHLVYLKIDECRKLNSFPLCPKVETLSLWSFNKTIARNIREETIKADGKDGQSKASTSTSTSTSDNNSKQPSQGLTKVSTDDLELLNCHLMKAFQHHSTMYIVCDEKTERLTAGEVFQSGHSSSLGVLQFAKCLKLKSLSGQGVWEQFTALETLSLIDLPELEVEEEDDENMSGNETNMPWRCLALTLHNLKLSNLPKMEKLPKGMQQLSALQSLQIRYCHNLEEIPTWIGCLSSLQSLEIFKCEKLKALPEEMRHLKCLTHLKIEWCSTELTERCQHQTGADWPKIQHILQVEVVDSD